MHAQTIPTAAQTSEAVSSRAKAALTAAASVQTLADAIAAGLAFRNGAYEAAGRAHNVAECEVQAASAALKAIPTPSCLVVPSAARRLTKLTIDYSDGTSEVNEADPMLKTVTLRTSDEIMAYAADTEQASEMFAALTAWETLTGPAEDRLAAAHAAEREADAVWQAALSHARELADQILDAPALPSEMAAKVDAYAYVSGVSNSPAGGLASLDDDDSNSVLEAVLRDVATLGDPPRPEPTSDAFLIDAIDEVASLNVAELATNDMEEANRLSAAKQNPIDVALASRATTVAGLQARVRLVELWMPGADMLDWHDLEWMVVRSLLDDIKALNAMPGSDAALNTEAATTPAAAFLPEFERRWAIEAQADHQAGLFNPDLGLTDEQLETACDYTGAVANRIIATPGQSVADFKAKARAVLWCANDRPEDWEAEGTINRFAKSLVLELLGHAPSPVNEAKLAAWDAAGEALVALGAIRSAALAIAAE